MVLDMHEQQLYDYINCPVFYDIKYRNKFSVQKYVTFNSLLNQVVLQFCSSLLEGKIMTNNKVKRSWDKLCVSNAEKISSRQAIKGISLLLSFCRWAENAELTPVDVSIPYVINAQSETNSKDTISLKGVIPILALTKNRKIEEIIFDFRQKPPSQETIDRNLTSSFHHVAFWTIYKEQLVGTKVVHVPTGEVLYTIRDVQTEYKKVCKIINNVYRAIKNNICYPHPSIYCESCDTKYFCKMWGIDI